MKNITLIILGVLLAIYLNSCVSVGTYDEMVAKRDSLQLVVDSLQDYIFEQNTKNIDLLATLDGIRTSMSKLQRDRIALQTNYDELKSATGEELQDVIEQMERLRVENSGLIASSKKKDERINEIDGKLKAREEAMAKLKEKLSNALTGFESSGLSVSVKNGKVYVSLSNQLLFKSGSSTIDKNGKSALIELAKVLNEQDDLNILVEGHTDNQAVRSGKKYKDNWDLSVIRATEVVRYLTEDGEVNPKRIIASGRSEYFPIEEGSTRDIRSINRRTEIILTPRLDEIFEMIGN